MSFPSYPPTSPPTIAPQATVEELKKRLDWGEPGLTIIDTRNLESYNHDRIRGAISMPFNENLVDRAKASLEPIRDIYVYGDSDRETAESADRLRQAGLKNVAEISGGLSAWQASGFPVEAG